MSAIIPQFCRPGLWSNCIFPENDPQTISLLYGEEGINLIACVLDGAVKDSWVKGCKVNLNFSIFSLFFFFKSPGQMTD